MALFDPKFKDITMETQYLKAHVGLSIFGGRFKKAQEWLEQEFVRKMTPFVPYKTGEFLGKILNENARSYTDGKIITSVPPQGRKLYPGVSNKGIPFNWTNPQTKPMWGEYTALTYKADFINGVRDIILGRKK